VFIFGWIELFGINNGKFFTTIGDKSVNRRDIRLDYQWHVSCSGAKMMNFKQEIRRATMNRVCCCFGSKLPFGELVV